MEIFIVSTSIVHVVLLVLSVYTWLPPRYTAPRTVVLLIIKTLLYLAILLYRVAQKK